MSIVNYIKKLFENQILVALSAIGAFLYWLCFPSPEYLYASGAVLGVMVLDLLTKIYALCRQNGGLRKAFLSHHINSNQFAKGTFDKLIVFGVLLTCCGLSYRVSSFTSIAVWFTQLVFTLMFFRDLISILENLSEAGISGLGIIQKLLKKKINEYTGEEDDTN